MDTSEMRAFLRGYLDELDWNGGITKDELMAHLAGRDEALRTMVNQYVAEGRYQDRDAVLTLIPAQAWQDAQGDTWRGSDAQLPEDIPSHFQQGAAGQDTSAVYHEGGNAPQTPGFGRVSGDAIGDSGGVDHSGRPFGEAGSNAGEVDLGVSPSGESAPKR